MPQFFHCRVSELQVTAHENPSPAVERCALQICIRRLGGNPEDGVDLEPGEIAVAMTAGEVVVGGGGHVSACTSWRVGVRHWLPRVPRWRHLVFVSRLGGGP